MPSNVSSTKNCLSEESCLKRCSFQLLSFCQFHFSLASFQIAVLGQRSTSAYQSWRWSCKGYHVVMPEIAYTLKHSTSPQKDSGRRHHSLSGLSMVAYCYLKPSASIKSSFSEQYILMVCISIQWCANVLSLQSNYMLSKGSSTHPGPTSWYI